MIGCWNGLAKHFTEQDESIPDWTPMKMAVAFAQTIASSKAASQAFPEVADYAIEALDGSDDRHPLTLEAQHVDGTMGIHERNAKLAWLKADNGDETCRILTNARCLSEGVDVPALDAVLFLTPRGSQVDVVQSVGRVMRKSKGKELGYIILPVAIPSGVAPEVALKDNERYKVVWQVLQALRSHDDRFNAEVNKIELNKKRPKKIDVITITGPKDDDHVLGNGDDGDGQLTLEFPADEIRDAMYARIVQKVGERQYWAKWAAEVAEIAQAHITRINGLLADTDSKQAQEFGKFLDGLRGNLNENITAEEAIEMLAQHLITRPIFDALFEGYAFAEHNPVAQVMEGMLAVLDEHNLDAENETLRGFYASVRRRVEGVDNAEGRQKILVELYDKFFATAFKRTVDKLGIVYTPVEIVDFILRSAEAVLQHEFSQSLSDENVHILDGFAGTGTFLARLLQSGLIKAHDLARKYAGEIHGNEILLLAYYIACVNIETTYQELTGDSKAFEGLILTDTFQSWEPDDRLDLEIFKENNKRLEELKKIPITVILGNPPYSVGQESANDNNANEKYPALDEEIRETYAEKSTAALLRNLYDSYIRAIKWASLRVQDRGVIAYITNGGFIDSNAFDGMRKTLSEEFSAIHVYNLRGNQRTAGELSRREGGKIFGGGSRATVAITVFVKDTSRAGSATIHYADIGDYLTREQKLAKVAEAASVLELPAKQITPNEHGDWINQRRNDFESFIALQGEPSLFLSSSLGVSTNRDAWMVNSSSECLATNVERLMKAFNEGVASRKAPDAISAHEISWSRSLRTRYEYGRRILESGPELVSSTYRPYFRQWLATVGPLLEAKGSTLEMFTEPQPTAMAVLRPNDRTPFAVLMIDAPPNLGYFMDPGQIFPKRTTAAVEHESLFEVSSQDASNVTDEALKKFQAAYPNELITKDDIFFYVYGLLHSSEYRQTYAADLKKTLPRIAFAQEFRAFADAGRKLSDLHLSYESVERYPLTGLDVEPPAGADPYDFFAVSTRKISFGGKGKNKDKTVLEYNSHITLSGLPEEAYRYTLGSRSAIEWLVDRYYVKTDKDSGIVNNPNDWSREVGDPRYIIDLFARITTVSLETMKIVDNLPSLAILEVG